MDGMIWTRLAREQVDQGGLSAAVKLEEIRFTVVVKMTVGEDHASGVSG